MKLLFRLLLFFIFLIISIANLSAKTHKIWYVDDLKDGQTGNGTKENQFRELQHAFDQAKDGDTVFIFPGTYEAESEEYIDELCGNCEEHKTKVNATRGFLIQGQGLNII